MSKFFPIFDPILPFIEKSNDNTEEKVNGAATSYVIYHSRLKYSRISISSATARAVECSGRPSEANNSNACPVRMN